MERFPSFFTAWTQGLGIQHTATRQKGQPSWVQTHRFCVKVFLFFPLFKWSQQLPKNPLIGKTTEQNMSWNKFTETHRKLWICLLKCTEILCARLVQVTSIIKSLANANRCRSPADKVAVQSRASCRPHFRNSGPIMARLGCGGFKWTKKRKET